MWKSCMEFFPHRWLFYQKGKKQQQKNSSLYMNFLNTKLIQVIFLGTDNKSMVYRSQNQKDLLEILYPHEHKVKLARNNRKLVKQGTRWTNLFVIRTTQRTTFAVTIVTASFNRYIMISMQNHLWNILME